MKCNPVEYYGHTIARLAIEQFPDGFDDEAGEGMQKSSRQLLRRLGLSEIKLAHTDDESAKKWRPWAPLGVSFLAFSPSSTRRRWRKSGVIDQTNFGLSFGPRVFPLHPQLLC
jgi:hypothetical protein